MRKFNSASAFSLIELSVVILIIGILVAGVTQASRLVSQMRLTTARTITQSAPVPSMKNLVAWYETTSEKSILEAESEDGFTVSNWADTNPTAITKLDMPQATAGRRPTYSKDCINGLPAIKFNGVDQYFEKAYTADLNPANFTIFAVTKILAVPSYGAILSSRSATGGPAGYIVYADPGAPNFEMWLGNGVNWGATNTAIPLTTNKTYVTSYTFNGSTVTTYSAGASIGSITENSFRVNGDRNTRIGAGSNESAATFFLNGHIGEIIIFDRALKNEERNSIEKYLGQKWGVKIS